MGPGKATSSSARSFLSPSTREMASSFPTSSRRTSDLPKPETGLAEWTSKIKALQRQVDADDEAEQKRLEEEIVAARQARLRRSRGMSAGSRIGNLDISKSTENLGIPVTNDTLANDTSKSVAERQLDQDTALRKLMGTNNVYNPDKITTPSRAGADKPESSSLAAFMGGRATGPRLNRHAPQPDAHDPTQFVQVDVTSPHPIFGRGGVAMPGMAAKKVSAPPQSNAGSEMSERYRPSFATPTKSPSPPTMKPTYVEKVEDTSNRELVDPRRRSFTGTPKSISPAIAQRYVEKVDEKPSHVAEPMRRNPHSFSSTPKPISPSPSVATDSPLPKLADKYLAEITPAPKWSTAPVTNTASVPSTKVGYRAAEVALPTFSTTPLSTPRSAGTQPAFSSYKATTGASATASTKETTLRKLMETNNVHNPDKITGPLHATVARAESGSLASFIGGRATGPRLNRHAPQPDAHDPTQFVQPDLSAPHPIFGRGGVAMPGMAAKKVESRPGTEFGTESSEHYRPSFTTSSQEKASEERPVSPQKTGNRERTTSAPSYKTAQAVTGNHNSGGYKTPNESRLPSTNRSPTKDLRSTTPTRDRTLSTPSYSRTLITSHETSRPTISQSSSASKSSIAAPGLARPIRPEPKISSFLPRNLAASPAFQKTSNQKDPTPSISRLQGRGFVQNMVQVSANFENAPPRPTTPADNSRPNSARKSTVLDRWQSNIRPDSSPASSASPSYANPMRRSTTYDTPSTPTDNRKITTPPSYTNGNSRTLKSVASLPSMAKVIPPAIIEPSTPEPVTAVENLPGKLRPGIGSASTVVVIKPSKSSIELSQLQNVDEYGMKYSSGSYGRKDNTQFINSAQEPPLSRKPLIHPTKDRARKPRKTKDTDRRIDSPLPADESDQDLAECSRKFVAETIPPPAPAVVDLTVIPPPIKTSCIASETFTIDPTELQPPSPSPKTPEPGISESVATPSLPVRAERSPSFSSPGRHVRIPSTGNRATVMEVAQALVDFPTAENSPGPVSPTPTPSKQEVNQTPESPSKTRNTFSQIQAEKRKSSYEKYSAIILPPLKEEATPIQSPAGTLTRADIRLNSILPGDESLPVSDPFTRRSTNYNVQNVKSVVHHDVPLPDIDISGLLKPRLRAWKRSPDTQSVSVEVLIITGTTATPLSRFLDVFYDSEILAIIDRTKSKSTGLVSTSIWCWLGKRSILGDREDKKVQELAKRYGTKAIIVQQLAETSELIQILGGRLAIRQGTRTHWSPENTTMHLVRSLNDTIVIDELDLSTKNLCSAFSYCVTILDTVYVWHGCGSTSREREAAVQYAGTMAKDAVAPVELIEGENDSDEMFWMILGYDDFAKADYWQWRKSFSAVDPSVWRIEYGNDNNLINPVEFISMEEDIPGSIYLINCVWELFVLVGQQARGNRKAIRLALDIASKLSQEVASERPHAPNVHVAILPSKLPVDLLLNVRDLDEAWLNQGDIPDHMNVLPISEANVHLFKVSWEQAVLKDQDMLPLVGFKTPSKTPHDSQLENWWCKPESEYAFLGFSYEVTACQSRGQLHREFKDIRNHFNSRYVRLYGACDREGDDIVDAAWDNSLGVHALIWFGFNGDDIWIGRRDVLLANLHSNPRAKFVTRVLQFGSEPLFDNVLSPEDLTNQVQLAKANLSSLGIPVTVSELAYGYQERGGAQELLDSLDSINIHMLPFFSQIASTANQSWPLVLTDLQWFIDHGNGKKMYLDENGWPSVTSEGVQPNSPLAVADVHNEHEYYILLDRHCRDLKKVVGGGVGWFAHIYNDNQEPGYGIYDTSGNLKFPFHARTSC
ncbi:hypothetical protein B0H34DRAFT_796031 [Crassisporium funariophilum]|nr:hypothetical protein B0H34DRAFT_796031 [Crassisporium funariophilum]